LPPWIKTSRHAYQVATGLIREVLFDNPRDCMPYFFAGQLEMSTKKNNDIRKTPNSLYPFAFSGDNFS
jgi:hypothetical protein